jgi:hypothetical protein
VAALPCGVLPIPIPASQQEFLGGRRDRGRESLTPEHVRPRLLGHWGNTPGLNFISAEAFPSFGSERCAGRFVLPDRRAADPGS